MSVASQSTASRPAVTLLHAVRNVVLPRMEQSVRAHTVIARRERKQLVAPDGFGVVPRRLRGGRVAVQNRKLFDRSALLAGRWPHDGMREVRIPKLMLVVEGQTGCRAGDYVLQCPTGSAVFFPPGVPHTDGRISHLETLPAEVESCSLLWFTPLVSGLACRMCHARNEAIVVPGLPSHEHREHVFLPEPRLLQLLFMLGEEAGEPGEARGISEIFENLLRAFLYAAVGDISSERFLLSLAPREPEQSLPQSDPIAQAMQFVLTHYAEPVALDDVARRFLMSRAQFTRRFRERTGHSFIEFLNQHRLQQAEQLLQQTEWTAAMIGRRVGFCSPAHFHELFLRRYGVSPIQYRKQFQNNALAAK